MACVANHGSSSVALHESSEAHGSGALSFQDSVQRGTLVFAKFGSSERCCRARISRVWTRKDGARRCDVEWLRPQGGRALDSSYVMFDDSCDETEHREGLRVEDLLQHLPSLASATDSSPVAGSANCAASPVTWTPSTASPSAQGSAPASEEDSASSCGEDTPTYALSSFGSFRLAEEKVETVEFSIHRDISGDSTSASSTASFPQQTALSPWVMEWPSFPDVTPSSALDAPEMPSFGDLSIIVDDVPELVGEHSEEQPRDRHVLAGSSPEAPADESSLEVSADAKVETSRDVQLAQTVTDKLYANYTDLLQVSRDHLAGALQAWALQLGAQTRPLKCWDQQMLAHGETHEEIIIGASSPRVQDRDECHPEFSGRYRADSSGLICL